MRPNTGVQGLKQIAKAAMGQGRLEANLIVSGCDGQDHQRQRRDCGTLGTWLVWLGTLSPSHSLDQLAHVHRVVRAVIIGEVEMKRGANECWRRGGVPEPLVSR